MALSSAMLALMGVHAQAGAQSLEDYATIEDPAVYTGTDSITTPGVSGAATAVGSAPMIQAWGTTTAASRVTPASRAISLNVQYVNTALWNPNSGRLEQVRLRNYEGASQRPPVGRTIETRPGGTLRISMTNKLPSPDTSCDKEGDHNVPKCFNTTNLHTHGLWVDPKSPADDVFVSLKPGDNHSYVYQLPENHPAGTFWYHAHVHGSTSLQVSSGMAGALIVRGTRQPSASANGDLDMLLRSTAQVPVHERIMMFQQIQYGCHDGESETPKANEDGTWKCDEGDVGGLEHHNESYFTPNSWGNSGRYTSINGRTLSYFRNARAGRLERWRMIHGGVRETIALEVREMVLPEGQSLPTGRPLNAEEMRNIVANYCTGPALNQHLVAADGLTMDQMMASTQTVFQPGYRWDALMMFPRAGHYCVMDRPTDAAGNANQVSAPQHLLGIVQVSGGENIADADVEARFREKVLSLANTNTPTDLREQIVADLNDGLKLTRYTPHASLQNVSPTEPTQTLTFDITNGAFVVDGKPFQPGVMGRLLRLGGVQDWELRSNLGAHPYHIHVNPFQILEVLDENGNDVSGMQQPAGADPQFRGMKGMWKDTVMVRAGAAPGPVTDGKQYTVKIRTRYERFHGDFVLHCHILDHEDQGMMEHVRIYDPNDLSTRDKPVPGHEGH